MLLKQHIIQANANVVALESSEDSSFDYWLRISTLEKGTPIRLPVKLDSYHRRMLDGKRINSSMTLTRKSSGWWLTLTVDEQVAQTTTDESPVVGVDVGIANFLTTSTGKRYGSFHGKLARRHRRSRRVPCLRAEPARTSNRVLRRRFRATAARHCRWSRPAAWDR